jgi:hypothetical protein
MSMPRRTWQPIFRLISFEFPRLERFSISGLSMMLDAIIRCDYSILPKPTTTSAGRASLPPDAARRRLSRDTAAWPHAATARFHGRRMATQHAFGLRRAGSAPAPLAAG